MACHLEPSPCGKRMRGAAPRAQFDDERGDDLAGDQRDDDHESDNREGGGQSANRSGAQRIKAHTDKARARTPSLGKRPSHTPTTSPSAKPRTGKPRSAKSPSGKSRSPKARSGDQKPVGPNLYQQVTDRIVAELEAGRCPWVQPWLDAAANPSLPRNAVTGRAYSGVNVLLLWAATIDQGYRAGRWLTFAQARDAGGMVRKGEHGVAIVFADRFVPDAEKTRAAESGADPRSIPFLKRFWVFNTAQIEGLPDALTLPDEPPPPHTILPAAQHLIEATAAEIRIGGSQAFYTPSRDFVQLPPPHAFATPPDYYATALHELAHWTGHGTRLARELGTVFGSPAYAREELTAELASAYLCASLGLAPTVRHADYLGHWLDLLRSDARAIFRAASAATKAADFITACAVRSGAVVPPTRSEALQSFDAAATAAAYLPNALGDTAAANALMAARERPGSWSAAGAGAGAGAVR